MMDRALRLLLDFDARVEREAAQPPEFLHRRDRRFALTCRERGLRADVRAWLDHLEHLSGPGGDAPRSIAVTRRWCRVSAGFALFGSLAGVLTMLGLLVYEGGQRINVSLLMAFVLLQLLLALYTSLQASLGWQPWRPVLARFLRDPPSPTVSSLQPLLMARAAHAGGTVFALFALLTLLVALVVQDLAFGWSTTLATVPERFAGLTTALAWPWRELWPAAVPDLALVEATRFYRISDDAGAIAPGRWGDWWPFIMMLWLCYVLLPRLALLALTQLQLQWRARRLLHRHPGWRALQHRMQTPAVDTGNRHHDAGDMPGDAQGAVVQPLPDAEAAVLWAGAQVEALPGSLLHRLSLTVSAGGTASLESDRRALAEIATALGEGDRESVLLVARGWEPPTGELQDFIDAAQATWPASARLVVLPLSRDPASPLPTHQLGQWLRLQERCTPGFLGVSLLPVPEANGMTEPSDD